MPRERKGPPRASQEGLCARTPPPISPAAWMGDESGPTAHRARFLLHLIPHGDTFKAPLMILNCNPTCNATPTYYETIVFRSITSIHTLDKRQVPSTVIFFLIEHFLRASYYSLSFILYLTWYLVNRRHTVYV